MERSELEKIMRLIDLSVVVCVRLSVYTNTQPTGTVALSCENFYIDRDVHSNQRLLVLFASCICNILCSSLLQKWPGITSGNAMWQVNAEMDTDRVHPRIGSGRVAGQTYILPHIFVHYFPSFVCLPLSLNWPERHWPVCSSRSDNQRWLRVILWVFLRRDSAQQKTEQRRLVAPSRRRLSLHEISCSRSLQR